MLLYPGYMTVNQPKSFAQQPHILLNSDDPPAVNIYNAAGASPFLLVADHAGNVFPRALGHLGIEASETGRHIAWDIGIAEVSRALADLIDAPLIAQTYSRLVIDCNRPPGAPTSIPTLSEATEIPGNRDLFPAAREAREMEIFRPYHATITASLDARAAAGRPTLLVAMHSFTPVYLGVARPWQAGLLYNRDAGLAACLLAALRQEEGLVVGDNEPYAVSDLTDYTIPVHGEERGVPHVGVEIRQDLISAAEGQAEWAQRMARALETARAMFERGKA